MKKQITPVSLAFFAASEEAMPEKSRTDKIIAPNDHKRKEDLTSFTKALKNEKKKDAASKKDAKKKKVGEQKAEKLSEKFATKTKNVARVTLAAFVLMKFF